MNRGPARRRAARAGLGLAPSPAINPCLRHVRAVRARAARGRREPPRIARSAASESGASGARAIGDDERPRAGGGEASARTVRPKGETTLSLPKMTDVCPTAERRELSLLRAGPAMQVVKEGSRLTCTEKKKHADSEQYAGIAALRGSKQIA